MKSWMDGWMDGWMRERRRKKKRCRKKREMSEKPKKKPREGRLSHQHNSDPRKSRGVRHTDLAASPGRRQGRAPSLRFVGVGPVLPWRRGPDIPSRTSRSSMIDRVQDFRGMYGCSGLFPRLVSNPLALGTMKAQVDGAGKRHRVLFFPLRHPLQGAHSFS